MPDKKGVQFGEGVADDLKEIANKQLSEIGKRLIDVFAEFVKGKIQEINLNELFSKKNEEELMALWSDLLAESGLAPKGYAGLPEELLIANTHQDGYLDGLYAGYALTMMAMIDNGAPKDLILCVRNDVRPNLIGQCYKDRDKLYSRYKDGKYKWVDTACIEDDRQK